MDQGALYKYLYNAYVEAYSDSKRKKWCQDETNKTWLTIKSAATAPDKADQLETKIQE